MIVTLKVLLFSSLLSCFFMCGLIWFVQVVHYPLFREVGEDAFELYHQSHTRQTGYIVGPVMSIELISAIVLPWALSDSASRHLAFAALLLLLVVWLSTALLQIPAHNALAQEFKHSVAEKLVRTNWIRTLAWSFRAIILCLLAFSVFSVS